MPVRQESLLLSLPNGNNESGDCASTECGDNIHTVVIGIHGCSGETVVTLVLTGRSSPSLLGIVFMVSCDLTALTRSYRGL